MADQKQAVYVLIGALPVSSFKKLHGLLVHLQAGLVIPYTFFYNTYIDDYVGELFV